MIIDGKDLQVSELSLNQCLSIMLIASYLYYIRYQSVITDYEFDAIAVRLRGNWGDVTHPHKHLVSVGNLRAGSLFDFGFEDYPLIVKGAAEDWLRVLESGKVAGD